MRCWLGVVAAIAVGTATESSHNPPSKKQSKQHKEGGKKKKKKKKPKVYLGSKVTPLPMIREYPLDDFLGQPMKHGRYIGPRAGAFDGPANSEIRTQQERAQFEVSSTFKEVPRGAKAPVTSSGWGI